MEFTEDELGQWEAQVASYFKQPTKVTGEAQKKQDKKAEQIERLASLDNLVAWQNMLFQHYGLQLLIRRQWSSCTRA
jgi:hypothetical protein